MSGGRWLRRQAQCRTLELGVGLLRAARAGGPRAPSRTSGCSSGSARSTPRTTRPTGPGGCGRRCAARARMSGGPCQAPDARQRPWRKRRGKPWRTHRRIQRPAAHLTWSTATSPPSRRKRVGVGFHVHPLSGRRRVLQLRSRRVLASARRLAVRLAHAHRARPRCPTDGLARPAADPDACSCTIPTPARNTAQSRLRAFSDHGVLASLGSVGDAYDNAMAESFVDTFKTELVADRVWRSRSSWSWRSSNGSAGTTTSACARSSMMLQRQSSRLQALSGTVDLLIS